MEIRKDRNLCSCVEQCESHGNPWSTTLVDPLRPHESRVHLPNDSQRHLSNSLSDLYVPPPTSSPGEIRRRVSQIPLVKEKGDAYFSEFRG